MHAAQDLREGANAVRTERGKFARYRWPAACSGTPMDALILTMFVSLVLAAGGVGMFVWLAGARTFDHADRLALLPMDDDAAPTPSALPTTRPEKDPT
jgi:nitrogen fixation-related uncharacterized protein